MDRCVKLLGLIPARGLSDRVPYKNLVDLGGRPLIDWTIEAARASGLFHTVAVSTEDSRVKAAVTHGHSDVAVLHRPAELAGPLSSSMSVVLHAVQSIPCDAIVLLQPTSPFRTAADIAEAWELLERAGGDSVVSVTDGPRDFGFTIGHGARLRSVSMLIANGAIYGITADALSRGEDFYSGVAYAYRMPAERSVDIDTLADLERARAMLVERAAA
jgi:CMP-N-acetylneuraminic acid synthetase